jgi:hypothetical protein
MTPHSPDRRHAGPALLFAGAIGVWFFVVSTYVAGLPDRVASPDQPERVAWVAD